jgi:hypothetical protein
MKKNRGSTIIEVVTGAMLMMLITLGTMSLMTSGLRYMYRTNTDLTISGKNALGLRYVSEYARGALSATITNSGATVNFSSPSMSLTTDANTGERELTYPVVSDGVTRGFSVNFAAGTMTDLHTNKVIIQNITGTDPDPNSSTYNQAYQPFSFSMVGSHKVMIIEVITKQKVAGATRYSRMKNTVLLRNT